VVIYVKDGPRQINSLFKYNTAIHSLVYLTAFSQGPKFSSSTGLPADAIKTVGHHTLKDDVTAAILSRDFVAQLNRAIKSISIL